MDPNKIEMYIKIGTNLFSMGFAAFDKIVDFARSTGQDDEKIAELKAKYEDLEITVAGRAGESEPTD